MLTLSQTTNIRPFHTERVCRRQFQISNLMKTGIMFFKGVENTVLVQAISPFSTVFSMDLYCRHVKTRACLGKG